LRRYSYTPRRSGRAVPRSQLTAQASFLPLLVPIVLVIAVVAGVGLLMRGGGGDPPSCETASCEPAVLGDTATPSAPAANPQPTPRHSTAPAPTITGLSAAVLEEPCGKQIYAFNANTRYPPASLTKMMTALVAVEKAQLSEVITSPIDGVALSQETDGTVMGLDLGEQMTLRDLLYGLLMRSGQDAAIAIADAIGGNEDSFVTMMNSAATVLGLSNTHFTNPHGLDDPHLYTSAHDIALIGHALLQQPALAEIVRTQTYTPDWDKGELENINLFLTQYPGAIGVKTGFTDSAGQTIVAAATRGDRTLLVSVLHSEDEYVDAGALLDWAFESTSPACSG
jgi:D-alanyl-D-alanine carboxypeptidase